MIALPSYLQMVLEYNALQTGLTIAPLSPLEKQLAGQPAKIRAEILDINADARPLALQVTLLVPLLAGVLGLINGFRMLRRPDPAPSDVAEMSLA